VAGYQQTNLIANSSTPFKGLTPQTVDASLVNPWGMVASASSPFWISDQATGLSTIDTVSQTGTVMKDLLGSQHNIPAVTIPTGSPTGIVVNTTSDFLVPTKTGSVAGVFIFDTLSGTIAGWNPNSTGGLGSAVTVVTNPGAMYTGLALGSSGGQNYLYAANNAATPGIDVYNSSFQKVTLAGNFVDPKLKPGFTPYNIANIDGQLIVTYRGPTTVGGTIAEFNTDGTFVRQIAKNKKSGHLQAPWGVTLAPADFGKFSNDLLVGNFGNGRINAYNTTTGKFAGQLTNQHRKPIAISGLWALEFGNGKNAGVPNVLYFTAGIDNQSGGIMGALQAVTPPAPATRPGGGMGPIGY
jgi:uncharacterized protein (TIGR03118 family)